MKLAIELSTRQKSLALQNDEGKIISESWMEDRSKPDPLHDKLEQLRTQAGLKWSELTSIYSGIGPGQYSGMRAAVATATGLALPGNISSHGISSGWAMAVEYAKKTQAEKITVIGDARRSRWWSGTITIQNQSPKIESNWKLYSREELQRTLADQKPYAVLTSEIERCEPLDWKLTVQYPGASDLLRVIGKTLVTDPRPIYLHPAV